MTEGQGDKETGGQGDGEMAAFQDLFVSLFLSRENGTES